MSDYYKKYIKYKTKYLIQRHKLLRRKYDYYLVHGTTISNLEAILEDGEILPGKDVDESRRYLSGGQPLDTIHMNIYFEDLRNISLMRQCALILHPKLLYEYENMASSKRSTVNAPTALLIAFI